MEVPGYTEIRELGHGGTGRVMLAVRDSDGLAVAIKHLSEPLRADAEFVARFREEALVIRELDSPHTARLLDYLEEGDDAVIVMELVEGVTLRRLLEHEGGTGAEAALVVLKGALLALAEAHRHGIAHRDFKPENVMITQEGDSKLVDFGVAARFGEPAPLAGTPAYMAPEQWDDVPAGPATDVYAAALVFYECLTGHRAFTGENVAALAYQHRTTPPAMDDVEEPLRPLVRHGLAKDPAGRPASAQELLDELEETARAVYGEDWELRGRTGLGILTLPLGGLLPQANPVAIGGNGTSLFHTTLSPGAKLAVTGALVLATAAAVAAAFVIWSERGNQSPGMALPPGPSATRVTEPPASPVPTATGAMPTAPPVPTVSPVSPVPITYVSRPTGPQAGEPSEPDARPVTKEPTRSNRPRPTGGEPATERPRASQRAERPDDDPPDSDPPAQDRPDTPPPATRAPDPAPELPPAKEHEPLVSISVSVSVGLPLLGGDGDGLLDVGLGLGSSLLGLAVVPGSVLLGRQIVVRRTRRVRGDETP